MGNLCKIRPFTLCAESNGAKVVVIGPIDPSYRMATWDFKI